MNLISKISLIVLILVLIYGGLYIHALSQIGIPELKLNSLEDVNLEGFKVSGDIIIPNNGFVPIRIGKIKYNITLDFNGEKLSEGELDGDWILPKKQKEYFFSNKILWSPSASLMLDLFKLGSTTATIDGFVYVSKLKIPFSQQIDLEEYMGQFTEEFIENIMNQVGETANNIVENIVDFFN